MSATCIGIAVVEREGCYLVGIRGPAGPLPGYAEFPGGKCRPGEEPSECAVRECAEETGLPVEPLELLLRREFTYSHGTVDLHFWLCRPVRSTVSHQSDEAESTKSEADLRGFRWIPLDELATLNFPDANAPVIELLKSRAAG